MQGVSGQRIAFGLFCDLFERPPAHKVNDDRDHEHAVGEPVGVHDMRRGIAEQTPRGFKQNRERQHNEQAGFRQRRHGLDLGVTIMVLVVGGTIRRAHGEPCQDGCAGVEQPMQPFRDQRQRTRQQACDKLADCQRSACDDGGEGGARLEFGRLACV